MGKTGAEWFMGNAGEKKKREPVNLAPPEGVTPAEIDDVVQLIDRAAGHGKKFTAGVRAIDSALDRLAECGVTPEALVLMVTEKAPYPRGAKNPLNRAQVEACLKGLFAISEFLR